MLISRNWLNEYLDKPVEAPDAATLLTNIGFPVEHTQQRGDDTILDVEVTSNRGDLLSHIGIARELAAASGRTLRLPQITLPVASHPGVDKLTSVTNNATDLCPLYTARVITAVKVAPSPAWLINRLQSIGLRTVNNIVDVTNFVLHELGQPLHAFDMKLLRGRKIIVRRATNSEKFTAIDASNHTLHPDMLVIADESTPVAIAGVMGGKHSEVTPQTTDILLESARFDPLSVRTTSRALKLSSDSSYRFERGVDPQGVDRASQRAAQLIVQLAGGQLADGMIAAGQPLPQPQTLTMRPSRCNALLGINVPTPRMLELLAALGLQPKHDGNDTLTCTIPSHRLDLEREVDLIEEVARLHGYDTIPTGSKMHIEARPPQSSILARRIVSDVLIAHGYHETISFSFIAPAPAKSFITAATQLVQLDDERRAADSALRPSLLPSLLQIRKTNQDAGNPNVKLFEVARTFARRNSEYVESKHLSLLADVEDDASLRALRGSIEELLQRLGANQHVRFDEADSPPGWASIAGRIVDADRVIGEYGRASPDVLKQFDLKTAVDLGWLDYDAITAHYPPAPKVQPLARFPGIQRDLSLIVSEDVRWSAIEQSVRTSQPALMESIEFITTYRGKQAGEGRKSVTLRLHFRDPQKTLRHEEVDPQMARVVTQLQKDVNAQLRQ